MSKKIAAGANAIVLDVKTGEGAFMKTAEDAEELAHAMVGIGNATGRKTMAIISDMSQPLGFAIGNALEVKEAIETLQGKGPEDLTELCLVLGSQMVVVGGKADSLEEAREMLEEVIANGKALEIFRQFIEAQGGNPAVVDDVSLLPQAKFIKDVPSQKEGYVSFMEADEIGTAAMVLGAGRATKESVIDLAVGIVLHKKVGDFVKKGEAIATVYSNTEDIAQCTEMLYNSIEFKDEAVEKIQLISKLITD